MADGAGVTATRVLVTGAGGFVGRHLVRALAGTGDVIGIDRAFDAAAGGTMIAGDLTDADALALAFAAPVDVVVHLATLPGGAAEADPAQGWHVNMDGSFALLEAAARQERRPRVVFASSIAVFGDPLPALVDDATPLRPRMVYGAHKAMIEQWVATLTRRGAIDGLSLRLPGIVARPRAPSGMKSAFMSDVFHALRAGERFVAPVSAEAGLWLMSIDRVVRNLVHAIAAGIDAGEPFALTLPAVRATMAELVGEIARQADVPAALVDHDPDPLLEARFGRQPPLLTPRAEALGFAHDGSLADLVAATLAPLETTP